jgi:hypothetical protein
MLPHNEQINLPVSPGTALAGRVWVKMALEEERQLGSAALRP